MFQTKIISVLYVDDERHNLQSFNSSFRRIFNVFTAVSAEEAEVILFENEIHVLIVDQRMPSKTGIKFLTESLKNYPDVSRILLTTYGERQDLIEAINIAEVFRFIEKPWDGEKLERFIIEGYAFYKRNNIRLASI